MRRFYFAKQQCKSRTESEARGFNAASDRNPLGYCIVHRDGSFYPYTEIKDTPSNFSGAQLMLLAEEGDYDVVVHRGGIDPSVAKRLGLDSASIQDIANKVDWREYRVTSLIKSVKLIKGRKPSKNVRLR